MFAKEKSAGNRKKAEKTETGKASIALIHAQTEMNRNYICFNVPLHLKYMLYVYSLFFWVVRTNFFFFSRRV